MTDPLLSGADDTPLSDPATRMTRAEAARLAADIRRVIAAEGLAGARLCLALDASLGSLAMLVALLESPASVALIPRPAEGGDPDDPDWPGFCDAALMPPDAGLGAQSMRIVPLRAAPGPDRPRDEDRVYLRTSGTTGTPKWAVHRTADLLANCAAARRRLTLGPDDRVMLPVPIHHMYGLGAGLLPSLQARAAIHLVPRGNPLEVFQAQRGFAPDVMFLVPSQCRSIMALGRSAGFARLVVVAGDRLAPDEAAAFERDHGAVVPLYGSTEMGVMCTSSPAEDPRWRHLTAGTPVDGMTLALADGAAGDDAVHEMRLRADHGLLGYTDPGGGDGSVTVPAADPWVTGDLVRLHEGGRVEVLGRADHAVNRDGLLVHMGQIEGVMSRAEGVAMAAVVTAGHSRRGAGLVAWATLTRPGITDEAAILARCRAELPARAVPDRLILADALPMLPSGKVDRRALTARAQSETAAYPLD